MATLSLDRLWINLVSTGDAVSGFTAEKRGRSHGAEGVVSTYAGGRRRAITSEGVEVEFAFTLRDQPAAIVDTLVSWIGQTVAVRDHLGQRFVGVYFAVIPVEVGWMLWDVSIVVKVVTVPEGV